MIHTYWQGDTPKCHRSLSILVPWRMAHALMIGEIVTLVFDKTINIDWANFIIKPINVNSNVTMINFIVKCYIDYPWLTHWFHQFFHVTMSEKKWIPSGNLTVRYGKWPLYRGFSLWKWWIFPMALRLHRGGALHFGHLPPGLQLVLLERGQILWERSWHVQRYVGVIADLYQSISISVYVYIYMYINK